MSDARDLLQRCVEALEEEMHNGTAEECSRCEAVRDARAYLAAVPAPPAELRVPREPTEQMMYVGGRSLIDGQEQRRRSSWADEAAAAWRAMYDAAPAAEPVAQPEPCPRCGSREINATYRYCKNCSTAWEPVAQQPPPSREHALDELAAIGQEMGEYAAQQPPPINDAGTGNSETPALQGAPASPIAQQPEAPTLADDLVVALREQCTGKFHGGAFARSLHTEAAARIESDAKRIRRLEADVYNAAWNLGGCDSLANGWLKPDEPINESMARPALLSVRKMAGELAASHERELAAYERAAKLLWAMRALVITTALDFESRCGLCGERWPNPQFERHAPDCLAAPDSAASPTGGEE